MSKEPYYIRDAIKDLDVAYRKIDDQKNDLLLKYARFHYANEKAQEYAHHGLMRRIGIMNRCLHNVFTICPPDQVEKITNAQANDLAINLQSFVANVFGCLDNIAWIWTYQHNLGFKKHQVGLKRKHKDLRSSLPKNFCGHIESFGEWFEYIENYRDALGYRIPLYVSPMSLSPEEAKLYDELEKQKWDALVSKDIEESERIDKEQYKLGRFYPWMQHSFSEAKAPKVHVMQNHIHTGKVVCCAV